MLSTHMTSATAELAMSATDRRHSTVPRPDSSTFEEVLDAETNIDVLRMSEYAWHGIPPKLRSTGWLYMLGVTNADKSAEITQSRLREEQFTVLTTAHKDPTIAKPREVFMLQLQQVYPEVYGDTTRRGRVARIMEAFLISHMHYTTERSSQMLARYLVFLVRPLEHVVGSLEDLFFSLEALVYKLELDGNSFNETGLRDQCGVFMMLLRDLNSVLYTHLHNEGVRCEDWMPEWLVVLFANRLPMADLLHLWDAYFSELVQTQSFPLHMYVCLAFLETFADRIMEMEKESILDFFRNVPPVHIPQVLQHAKAIRETVRERELV